MNIECSSVKISNRRSDFQEHGQTEFVMELFSNLALQFERLMFIYIKLYWQVRAISCKPKSARSLSRLLRWSRSTIKNFISRLFLLAFFLQAWTLTLQDTSQASFEEMMDYFNLSEFSWLQVIYTLAFHCPLLRRDRAQPTFSPIFHRGFVGLLITQKWGSERPKVWWWPLAIDRSAWDFRKSSITHIVYWYEELIWFATTLSMINDR